jgi:hypothetical protein
MSDVELGVISLSDLQADAPPFHGPPRHPEMGSGSHSVRA